MAPYSMVGRKLGCHSVDLIVDSGALRPSELFMFCELLAIDRNSSDLSVVSGVP